VVCDNGNVFVDEDAQTYVANSMGSAEEYLEILAHSGWPCECDDHRIVTYIPQVK